MKSGYLPSVAAPNPPAQRNPMQPLICPVNHSITAQCLVGTARPKRSQVIEGQGSLSQDKTSLPSYHLMLSSYHTAPVQSQMEMAKDGYLSLQRKRHDFLGDVVSSHSTICPCQNLTQWGLVWPLHSKCNIDSKPWGSNQGQQRANMLRKVNNSPECVCV